MNPKRKQLNLTIDVEDNNRIEDICSRTSHTKSQLARMILKYAIYHDIVAEECCILQLADELGNETVDIAKARGIVHELLKVRSGD